MQGSRGSLNEETELLEMLKHSNTLQQYKYKYQTVYILVHFTDT
jgi:hypothetical protein